MSTKSLRLLLCVAVLFAAGCDTETTGLENPDQPKNLGAPWVNRTDRQIGSSSSSGDAEKNHIFGSTTNRFSGLVEHIASEFEAPIAVKPKKMLDWNLTVEVKGKTLDEVLQDVATKCKLTLTKSSGGLPMLAYPGDTSTDEHVVKPDVEEGESTAE